SAQTRGSRQRVCARRVFQALAQDWLYHFVTMPRRAPGPQLWRGSTSLPAIERRLRVMHVVLNLDPGGTERLVIEISKTLLRDAQPMVCCLDREGAWASELTDLDVPVLSLERRAGFRPGLGLAIGR